MNLPSATLDRLAHALRNSAAVLSRRRLLFAGERERERFMDSLVLSPLCEYVDVFAVIGVLTVGAAFASLNHRALGLVYLLAVILLCVRVGPGLSIVRGFMLAQDGEVAAENNWEGGASFSVYLPHATAWRGAQR